MNKQIKITIPIDSTAFAIWSLLMHRGRVGSRAVEILLLKSFDVFKEAGVLENYFSSDVIDLINDGMSPKEVLKHIQNNSPKKEKKQPNKKMVRSRDTQSFSTKEERLRHTIETVFGTKVSPKKDQSS